MTEKLALQIAYNILNDELDRAKEEYSKFADVEEYYQEIKDAAAKIKEMIKERK